MSDTRIAGKTADQLIASLDDVAQVGSPVHEQLKMAILARLFSDLQSSTRDLTQAILLSGAESATLAKRLLYLNVIVAGSTVVYTLATVWSAVASVK